MKHGDAQWTRAMVSLRMMENVPIKQIAAELGISERSVKKMIQEFTDGKPVFGIAEPKP
jgi:transposase-like protein